MQTNVISAQSPESQNGAPSPDQVASSGGAPSEFISFAIGNDQYGVDIMAVREIKEWSRSTALPGQPDYMRGVLNLRGVMIPIIDLRCRFDQGLTDASPMHIVIVVQVGGKTIGLLADQVLDIIEVNGEQIQPVPQISRDRRTDFLSGLVTVEAAMIALINLNSLLDD